MSTPRADGRRGVLLELGCSGGLAEISLLGAAYRWIYPRHGQVSGYDPIRTATYLTILWTALDFEGSIAMLHRIIVKTIVLIWAMLFVLRRTGAVVEVREAGAGVN